MIDCVSKFDEIKARKILIKILRGWEIFRVAVYILWSFNKCWRSWASFNVEASSKRQLSVQSIDDEKSTLMYASLENVPNRFNLFQVEFFLLVLLIACEFSCWFFFYEFWMDEDLHSNRFKVLDCTIKDQKCNWLIQFARFPLQFVQRTEITIPTQVFCINNSTALENCAKNEQRIALKDEFRQSTLMLLRGLVKHVRTSVDVSIQLQKFYFVCYIFKAAGSTIKNW